VDGKKERSMVLPDNADINTSHKPVVSQSQPLTGAGVEGIMGKPIETVYAAFGMKIRIIRETINMPQGGLAKLVGLTRTSIVNIEAGRQRILLADVERFAKAFNTTPRHLLKGIWT
jgi:DNA-binding XRE family transcriptional regulator